VSAHIGDDAALYALGAFDEGERARIDEHVLQCDACAQLLGTAEDDVARMVAAAPGMEGSLPTRTVAARRRPAWLAYAGAIAAALVIGLVPSFYFWEQDRAMHETMVANADAMSRLAHSPFRSADFTGMEGGSTARVMYGADGSWYVVLVRGASHALHVVWMHDGQQTMLGTAAPHGDVAMLYLPKSHRMDQLALVDGQRVVAEAQLAY